MKTKTSNILLSLIIALGLWIYVSTVVTTTIDATYYNLEVALQGESVLGDRNLMLISVENNEVDLTIHGSRQNVGKIKASDLQLVADLTNIYSAGTYNLTYAITYPGDVPSGSVSELSKSPDRVTVVVAERTRKEVPVEITYNGFAADGYIMDPSAVELSNTYVTVSGPKEVVDLIDHASITLDCENATETIVTSQRYVLRDAENEPVDASLITVDVEQVQVTVPVSMLKTIPVKLTIVPGGGAAEETSEILIDPAELSISGDAAILSNLNELVLGTVDLGEITDESWTKTYDIVLPEGVENRSGITTATVTISFPRLATREFTITAIQYVNQPDNMKVQMLTKQLTITVRGLKEEVAALTPADIVAQVDLSGVENTAAVEPEFIFGSKFASVDVLGKYSVSVMVSEE